jgi:hypothetical protein
VKKEVSTRMEYELLIEVLEEKVAPWGVGVGGSYRGGGGG